MPAYPFTKASEARSSPGSLAGFPDEPVCADDYVLHSLDFAATTGASGVAKPNIGRHHVLQLRVGQRKR